MGVHVEIWAAGCSCALNWVADHMFLSSRCFIFLFRLQHGRPYSFWDHFWSFSSAWYLLLECLLHHILIFFFSFFYYGYWSSPCASNSRTCVDAEEPVSSTPALTYPPLAGGSPASSAVLRTFGVIQRVMLKSKSKTSQLPRFLLTLCLTIWRDFLVMWFYRV